MSEQEQKTLADEQRIHAEYCKINDLHSETGLPRLKCRVVLEECGWNYDEAIANLAKSFRSYITDVGWEAVDW